MASDEGREEFLRTLRSALGRSEKLDHVEPPYAMEGSEGEGNADDAETASARAQDLVEAFVNAAREADWTVVRANRENAAAQVRRIVESVEATSALRSAHAILDAIGVDDAFKTSHASLNVIAYDSAEGAERAAQREAHRQAMIAADVGVTGVEYAIAETGSVVIAAGKGISRLISLLPPVHVAVATPDQVLPSLDELFANKRGEFLRRGTLDYANIISGPSRTADIEQTLIKGMHGPREVYLVLVE